MGHIVKLIAGIPCSGKDHYSLHHGGVVVSFDDIRVEEYEKKYPNHGLDPITLYDKAWAYCNSARIDLMMPLITKVINALMNGKIPHICNTLLTRKSRAAMVKVLKEHIPGVEIHAIFLTVPSAVALKRNRERTSHRLSEEVMQRFFPVLRNSPPWMKVSTLFRWYIMGSIMSAIEDDIKEYLGFCKKFNEQPKYSDDSADCYGEHAKLLKAKQKYLDSIPSYCCFDHTHDVCWGATSLFFGKTADEYCAGCEFDRRK